MRTFRRIVAGTAVITALLFFPSLVQFATAAHPPVTTRTACRLASPVTTHTVLGVEHPSTAGLGTSADTSSDAASVGQIVRSSAKTQLTLLKMVELGLCAAHGDGWNERR